MASYRSGLEDDARAASELGRQGPQTTIAFLPEPDFQTPDGGLLCLEEHSEAVFLPIVAERLQQRGRINYMAWWGWEAKGGVYEARFL